jgi:PAS domain S-box-containing protein
VTPPAADAPVRLRFVSLRTKFLLGTGLVLIVLMAAVTGIVERQQRRAIIDEVQRRGMVLAESLAAISTGPLLLYNFTALEQNVARMDTESDVVYALILDRDGRVAAHSQAPALVGAVLDDPVSRRAVEAASPIVQEVAGRGGEALYDFAVPLLVDGQRWGTARIALSRQRTEVQIAQTRRQLALLAGVTLVLGGLASAFVAQRIARPVRQLWASATAVAGGDLNQKIDAVTSDEIGQLAVAFNDMVGQLRRQRADLEAAHAALRLRFTELSDLKSYTDHVLRSLVAGIVTLDLDGRVVTLNPAAETLTGRRDVDVKGRGYGEAFAHLPELRELLRETLETRRGLQAVSLALRPRETDSVPVEVTTTPLTGAEGQALGVIAALRDLTTVRQLEEQLRRSDRLAALGTLAAGLAHEIKNPLTSVMTFSRHVARRFGDERFRQRFQSVVPRELERINRIVEDLLRLARPSRLALQPVRLPELLDQALELYADQIEAKGIQVVRDWARGLPPIAGDAEHLYQAVTNLVTNAVEAMGAGGTLTVRAGWADPASPRLDPARGGRELLRLEIQDTGEGIAPTQTTNVFDPFFTTKTGGTGLGLAIAHKIVEDHGGTISFRSTRGRGTTFTVLLPVLSPGDDARPAAREPAREAQRP